MSKTKNVEELFPDLNWPKSFEAIFGLDDTENDCMSKLATKYAGYVKIWEYAYYYLSLIIQKSKVRKSYGILASMYTEAHSSLRTSFICNLKGYHADSLALLRRVHEAVVKMIAIKVFPKEVFSILQNSSIQKPESKLNLKMKWISTVEGSFLHSNTIKAYKIGVDIVNKNEVAISYGPQLNDNEFQSAANLSIFWMYVISLVAPRTFPDQLSQYTIDKNEQTCKLLYDFLKGLPKSELSKSADQIKSILDKIGPMTNIKMNNNRVK